MKHKKLLPLTLLLFGLARGALIYDGSEGFMDTSFAARRTEDIALDLLKFIASTTNVVKGGGSSTPGFGGASTAKGEDQVTQLLDLYGRCRQAVETGAK